MSEGKIHGYLVKYALSSGIKEATADVGDGGYVYVPSAGPFPTQGKIGVTFFTDRTVAEAAAKRMAARKIASLEKQIAKLRKLADKPKWEVSP